MPEERLGRGAVPVMSLAQNTLLTRTEAVNASGWIHTSKVNLLAANLISRFNVKAGGTGLNPAVEQAIWDRARSRETETALANEADILRTSEAAGFALPTGVVAAQIREAQQDYFGKLSSLSRDVAIKQAELEQDNLKHTIDAGMALESKLIDYSYQLERLTFEAAKNQADNAIQIHNAQVEQYKALLSVYQVYSDAYKSIISAELAKVDAFKALISAEQAKADINKSLVEEYKAMIQASMAYVEIYTAEVGAAKTLVEIEGLKISAAAEQIKAFVATVNAETAKIEAYKAGVDAEASKVQVYKIKADVFATESGVQLEAARVGIANLDAQVRAKASRHAVNNPKALFRREVTEDDVKAYRKEADLKAPFHRLGEYVLIQKAGMKFPSVTDRLQWESVVAAFAYSQIAADDRFHFGVFACLVKIDSAKKVSVICQGHSRQTERRSLICYRLQRGGRIENRILGMNMERDPHCRTPLFVLRNKRSGSSYHR